MHLGVMLAVPLSNPNHVHQYLSVLIAVNRTVEPSSVGIRAFVGRQINSNREASTRDAGMD
jgi:hypothetical protein